MTIDELKIELGKILSEEEKAVVDWEKVERLSERIYVRLTTEHGTPQGYPQEAVIGYLAGYLRRRSDEKFGSQQRQWVKTYVGSQEA